MPESSLPTGLLSKPEALSKYQKPERTFQRRLSKALRLRNDDFLSHFYLATSDGKVRSGVDVEEGEVEQLKGQGLYPIWHVEEDWFSTEYDQRRSSKTQSSMNTTATSYASTPATPDHTTRDRPAMVSEIESLRRELTSEKDHIDHLKQQMAIKDDQIKAANEIARETNEREKESNRLMAELTKVIKQAQQQPRLDPSHAAIEHSPTTTNAHSNVTDAEVVETAVAVEGSRQAKAPQSTAKKPAAAKAAKKRKATAKRKSKTSQATKKSTNTKKPATTKKSPAKKPASKSSGKSKWYNTPTLRKLFQR